MTSIEHRISRKQSWNGSFWIVAKEEPRQVMFMVSLETIKIGISRYDF